MPDKAWKAMPFKVTMTAATHPARKCRREHRSVERQPCITLKYPKKPPWPYIRTIYSKTPKGCAVKGKTARLDRTRAMSF